MAELANLARPVVRRCARFHPDQTRRQLGKERPNLLPTHRATQRHHPCPINSMDLKHCLGQIQPNRCNLFHGWLPSVGVVDNPTLARECRGAIRHQAPTARLRARLGHFFVLLGSRMVGISSRFASTRIDGKAGRRRAR